MVQLGSPDQAESYHTLPRGSNRVGIIKTVQTLINPHGYLESMVKRYGDIYTDRFFGFPNIVFVSNPQAIQQIFTSDPTLFESGQGNAILKPLMGGSSIIFLDGDRHLRRRKLLMPPFHGERMKAYGSIIRDVTQRVMEEPLSKGEFIARPIMQEISLQVILQAVFGLKEGKRYGQISQALVNYLDFFNFPLNAAFIFFRFLQRDLGSWSPWARFLRLKEDVDRYLYQEIRERRERPDPSGEDIMSLLLCARDEDGQGLTDRELRDELFALLIAGHETTSLSICWALYWIHLLPEVQGRLREELATLDPSSADPMEIVRLPYLNAVCLEALRIYPVALFAFSRILQAPMDLMGYRLPKGTTLSIPIYLVHQRRDLYPQPKRFNPERFLERQFSPYEYLPFGGGSRRCIGSAFALFEMKIVLATLLSNCSLTLNERKPVLPVRRGVVFAPSGGVRLKVKS